MMDSIPALRVNVSGPDLASTELGTEGNVGLPKRYWFLSSFMAAVAATMNCRQIGAA
jgi:hypothetical protein